MNITADYGMTVRKTLVALLTAYVVLPACNPVYFLKGGIYRELDANLTITALLGNPDRYLDKVIVFSVRFYKKGNLPCPLGEGYQNFVIADRISYITLDKVWMKKDKASVLDTLSENETIVMRAKVFKVDNERDPNLEALEIVKE